MASRLLELKKDIKFNEELRIAVFGTGYWSTLQIPAWHEVGGVKIVAVYNRTLEKAERVAQRFGVPKAYSNPEELLQKEEIDLMDIITEIPVHAPLVKLAAKYRIPVLCQKPMGSDLKTCMEMVAECKKAGVPLFINENYRWQPPLRAVKQALRMYDIGKPYRAHIQLGTGGPLTYVAQPFLKTLKHPTITDMGSHIFDLARFYFGEPDSIYCQTHKTRDFLEGEDVMSAMLRIGDVICVCDVSERFNSRVFIEGTEGSVELRNDNTIHVATPHEEVEIRVRWPRYPWISPEDENLHGSDCIHSIVECQRHLIKAFRSGEEAETTGEDNLKTMKLVFAAIESAETGERVDMESTGNLEITRL